MTRRSILGFPEIDKTKIPIVGGKGANLGELSRIEGVQVPDGFCVSTDVFREIVGNCKELHSLLGKLAALSVDDRKNITGISAKIRKAIELKTVPEAVAVEITLQLKRLGEEGAYAVRSSATAEDLPDASSAGQQDTFLSIVGKDAILNHISKCWASLFTERAVVYRMQNGIDHRQVQLAVVIQRMVLPHASGIMFTADPVTGNRKVLSVDAGFGLGDALVSGFVNADVYKVCDGKIKDRKISAKKVAVYAVKGGGTQAHEIDPGRQNKQVLTDDQILQLERLGRKIEKHFGSPQDIEWCLAEDALYVVQSRPVTTLYPIPETTDDENHVYVSVGHQQMMTDAMKPLGLSMWRMMAPRPMPQAGGRLFVDVTSELASPVKRNVVINVLGKQDQFVREALTTVLDRGFIKPVPDETPPSIAGAPAGPSPNFQSILEDDPQIVTELVSKNAAAIEQLKQDIRSKSGPALFDFISDDILRLRKFTADPRSFGAVMTSMNAASWINEKMEEWLGEKNAADTLAQSAPGNVTSEMGLELLNVADVIRPHPQVIEYLQRANDDDALDGLAALAGGRESREAILAFLDKYGMRCSGEIDITRTRWSEKPTMLVPVILGNIRNFESGAAGRKFGQGLREASKKESDLL